MGLRSKLGELDFLKLVCVHTVSKCLFHSVECFNLSNMIDKPCGARRKRSGALDSCFGLVSPHQQSIPFPYLQCDPIAEERSEADTLDRMER